MFRCYPVPSDMDIDSEDIDIQLNKVKIFQCFECTYVLSHVKTNNKSPTKYFELDSASFRAAKELSVDTNRASLRQLLAAQ